MAPILFGHAMFAPTSASPVCCLYDAGDLAGGLRNARRCHQQQHGARELDP